MSLNSPIRHWTGLRVWIVGASSGIGAALAQTLAAKGARVAVSARRADTLQCVAQAAPALALPMDATSLESWQRNTAQLKEAWGGIDLLLFCPAIYQPARSWEITPEQIRQTLTINVEAAYLGLNAVLPTLLNTKGGIGIIASVAGYHGLPNAALYGPSKAALINLAEILHYDLSPQGMNVYLINPGFVDTPMTAVNGFEMPALQTPAQAAKAIVRGMEKGAFEIHFPRRFTIWLKILRLLPYRLSLPLIRKGVKL